jgi:hypothetical protein
LNPRFTQFVCVVVRRMHARSVREREMVRDGVGLINEFVGVRGLVEDQFARASARFRIASLWRLRRSKYR